MRTKLAGTENDLYIQIARYLNMQYPGVMYHFDLSGVNNQSPLSRSLYSQLNGRAYPDLLISESRHGFHGLFLELKKEGTAIYLKDGVTPVRNPHMQEQWAVIKDLSKRGYLATMVSGFTKAKFVIDEYLGGKL